MTTVYRILRRRFARNPFDGQGAYLFGGRWSSPGTRVAYTAEHLSLAMLEYLVHLDFDLAPPDLVLVTAAIPDSVSRTGVALRDLPRSWRDTPPPSDLTRYGDDFIRNASAAILIVPSALAPTESNWLINPTHPDFTRIRINPPQRFDYDRRLFD